MSRAAEGTVADTASKDSTVFNQNAQDAFTGANNSITAQQGDVDAFSGDLGKFAAANPYGAGGEFQTSTNKVTANTSDAASQAAAQAAGAAAVRTGQNASAPAAAGLATDQANARALMAQQAKDNATRISSGAGYNKDVLSASSIPASLQGAITGEQGKLAGQEGELGEGTLGIDQKASDDPNFGDTLGNAFAASLGKFAGSGGTK